jgi:2-dehydro-3-deoxygluconokinase
MQLLVAEANAPLSRATFFRSSIAGSETNVAVGLARLGHQVRWLGRVGADPSGQAVLRQLRAEGIDVSGAQLDPVRSTGVMLRDSHAHRPISVQYLRAGSAASAMQPDLVTANWTENVNIAVVSGITAMLSADARDTVTALFDHAAAHDIPVAFDPNIRRSLAPDNHWVETMLPLLRRSTLIFAGADELQAITSRPWAEAVNWLLTDAATAVVTKHRDKTATLSTREGEWSEPSRALTIVDPVGAGDAVTAGFVHAWLLGQAGPVALKAAVVVAAAVIASPFDCDGLPTFDELQLELLADDGTGLDQVQR